MPVQLTTGSGTPNDPRVITLDMYNDGRDNFDMHYYYTAQQATFGGQVNNAQWSDLETAVENYCTATGTTAAETALRFVHCFDDQNHKLYQRLQICKMVPAPPTRQNDEGGEVFDLDTVGSTWYEIKDSAVAATTDEMLEGPVYLHNLFYKIEPQMQTLERLADAPEKYVKNLVLPWGDEILQMYLDNGSPAGAGINIAACSFLGTPANVAWPHGLVLFLSDSEGVPMLNDQDYISIFHSKGADWGTACPPTCDVYIAPNL